MAEEKFTIVDLRKAVAKQTGTEEAQVGAFLSQLIAAIKEGLKNDKQVRISGLGTFKLQWVEPRKSVNISTGEPIIIDGYQKLSFTPEPSVKERINEPYADLVPVELDAEGNPIEAQEKPKSDRMQRFDEQALEIKDLLADLGAEIPSENADNTAAEAPADEITSQTEEAAQEEPSAEEALSDNEIDKAIQAAEATVAAVREIPKEPIDEEEPEKEPKQENLPTEPAEQEEPKKEEPLQKGPAEEEKPKKPFRGWLAALITVFVILLLLVAAFFFFQKKTLELIDTISERINGKEMVAETPEPEHSAYDVYAPDTSDSLTSDTLIAENVSEAAAPATAETETAEPKAEAATKAEAEPKSEATLPAANTDFYKERNYTDFIGIETVKEGSRLTWIAKKHYGSKELWVFIYEANKEKIKNPGNVVVGTQLHIPALPEEIIRMDTPKAQDFVKSLQDKYLNK